MGKDLSELLKQLDLLEHDAPQNHSVKIECDPVDQLPSHPTLVFSDYWKLTANDLALELQAASRQVSQLSAVENDSISRMDSTRNRILDLRTALTDMWNRCGVDTRSVLALTETAESDDVHDLYEEVPVVWAQSTDDLFLLADRTARLRLIQKLSAARKQLSLYRAASASLSSMQRREKRLKNDLDEARVVLEMINNVKDRVDHVCRMVDRSAIDEDALLMVSRTTILEEERHRFHLAGNDIKGLKAILRGPKMKAIQAAAVLPETAAKSKLLQKQRTAERATFTDIGFCRQAWVSIEADCEDVLAMVSATCATRRQRKEVADGAFQSLMQSLAVRVIADVN